MIRILAIIGFILLLIIYTIIPYLGKLLKNIDEYRIILEGVFTFLHILMTILIGGFLWAIIFE